MNRYVCNTFKKRKQLNSISQKEAVIRSIFQVKRVNERLVKDVKVIGS